MPCPRDDLSLGVPASFLAWSSSDQSPHRQRVSTRGLVEEHGGGLLSGGVWGGGEFTQCDSATNTVIHRRHSRWCLAYVEWKQALLNTTEVTRQQYSISFRWQPTNHLTSPPVDLWGQGRDAELVLGVARGRDAGTSGLGAVPLRLAQMIGQQKKPHKKKKKR